MDGLQFVTECEREPTGIETSLDAARKSVIRPSDWATIGMKTSHVGRAIGPQPPTGRLPRWPTRAAQWAAAGRWPAPQRLAYATLGGLKPQLKQCVVQNAVG